MTESLRKRAGVAKFVSRKRAADNLAAMPDAKLVEALHGVNVDRPAPKYPAPPRAATDVTRVTGDCIVRGHGRRSP